MNISGHKIGLNHPPFIIAEMSGNHNQSLQRAIDIVREASKIWSSSNKITNIQTRIYNS